MSVYDTLPAQLGNRLALGKPRNCYPADLPTRHIHSNPPPPPQKKLAAKFKRPWRFVLPICWVSGFADLFC